MSLEDLIITIYCRIEEMYQETVKETKLRLRGSAPSLSDVEVLTMLVLGEYLRLGSDKKIWSYFLQHWLECFPRMGWDKFYASEYHHTDLYLFDGFPIPVCHIKRYKRSSSFRGLGAVGYCAAKDQKYFGFKGHFLISSQGITKGLSLVATDIDERDVLPEVALGLTGDIIADKGLIRPELTSTLRNQGINLHTPLRKNVKDICPKKFVFQLMNIRRKVETVIGQLVDLFNIQSIRAKDMWHLMAKIGRKVFAHTICFFMNRSVNSDTPLQIEKLMA